MGGKKDQGKRASMLMFMLFLAGLGISVGLPSSNSEAVSEALGIAADEACPNNAAAAARPASYLSASCTLCAYNIFEGGARGAQRQSLREVCHKVMYCITSQQQIVNHNHFQEHDSAAILVHRALRRSHAGSETMSLRAQEIAIV